MDNSKTDLKKKLSPIQYEVTQEEGTEPPYQNAYWNHDQPGIYVDVVSGEVLFFSSDKYDAGCGWPSFTRPAPQIELQEKDDYKLGMRRTEVRSAQADSHLGHVFPDGPQEAGGMRYCINSAALRFIAQQDMESEGYGEYVSLLKAAMDEKETKNA